MDWDNKGQVLEQVKNNIFALQFASKRLRDDYDVVLAAVECHSVSLKFASERLRNNKYIVLVAVTNFGGSIFYASQRLRSDYDVALAAVQENIWSFGLVSPMAQALLIKNYKINHRLLF